MADADLSEERVSQQVDQSSKKRGRKRGSSTMLKTTTQPQLKKSFKIKRKTRSLGDTEVLECDADVYVKWTDGTSHEANILSVRGKGKEYYVHYIEYDRRMDEWITRDRIESVVDDTRKRKKKGKEKKGEEKKQDGKKESKEQSLKSKRKKWEEEHHNITKVKNIQCIQMGDYEIDTWYFSPYPQEFCDVDRMYICEFCLKYMKLGKTYAKHKKSCRLRHPPGNEIYRDGKLSVFEVDGVENKLYCQNLCLLSKLFLDHKTLYFDVDPFLFYIVTEVDEQGCHIVGYFSKEKVSLDQYNLACILVFPPFQRKGYGKFLISLSYELTKAEKKVGSPEKPLSDLGKLSFRSYWTFVLLTVLRDEGDAVTLGVSDLSEMTGIRPEDIISTLQSLNLIKYWKGQHIISVSEKVIETYLKSVRAPRLCDSSKLCLENATLFPEKKS
jgi:histone acetyltransferase MYST1